MECICTEKFFLVYLKFKFNEASCYLSATLLWGGGHPWSWNTSPKHPSPREVGDTLQLPLSWTGDRGQFLVTGLTCATSLDGKQAERSTGLEVAGAGCNRKSFPGA